jgi:hypothetical protein
VNAVLLRRRREAVFPPPLRHRRPISAIALLHQRSALASLLWLVKLGAIQCGAAATMNIWLHKQVMARLAANGGKLPADIKW